MIYYLLIVFSNNTVDQLIKKQPTSLDKVLGDYISFFGEGVSSMHRE